MGEEMENIVHQSRRCWVEGACRYKSMECCREGKLEEVVDGRRGCCRGKVEVMGKGFGGTGKAH